MAAGGIDYLNQNQPKKNPENPCETNVRMHHGLLWVVIVSQ
jgi:hypothetical protein